MTGGVSVEEAIFSTRSMRRLRPDPVPEAELRFLVDAAIQAPTGTNRQKLGLRRGDRAGDDPADRRDLPRGGAFPSEAAAGVTHWNAWRD